MPETQVHSTRARLIVGLICELNIQAEVLEILLKQAREKNNLAV